MTGYSENVSFVDDVDPNTGITTIFHYEGDQLTIQKSFDAEPHLRYAEQARQATAGMRWGEGRLIGHIPLAFYAEILVIKDPDERKRAIKRFLAERDRLRMFHRAGK